MAIKYDDLAAAFDFVSFAAPMEHRAYGSLDTGAIYWISETNHVGEEDLPDDLDTSDRYVAAFFRRRGGDARFKDVLATEGCLEKWYEFEAESTERALRDWCKGNEIRVAE